MCIIIIIAIELQLSVNFHLLPKKKKKPANQEVNQLANMQSWLDGLTD